MEVNPRSNNADKGLHGEHSVNLPAAESNRGRSVNGKSCGQKNGHLSDCRNDWDPRDWCEVSWKSIILARKERGCRGRGHEEYEKGYRESRADVARAQENDVSRGISGTGRGTDRHHSLEGVAKGWDEEGGHARPKDGRTSRMLMETEASSMRQHARKREDEVLRGGAQNFYKSVRVCESCFVVSSCMKFGMVSPC